jgi:hypothetical protein
MRHYDDDNNLLKQSTLEVIAICYNPLTLVIWMQLLLLLLLLLMQILGYLVNVGLL